MLGESELRNSPGWVLCVLSHAVAIVDAAGRVVEGRSLGPTDRGMSGGLRTVEPSSTTAVLAYERTAYLIDRDGSITPTWSLGEIPGSPGDWHLGRFSDRVWASEHQELRFTWQRSRADRLEERVCWLQSDGQLTWKELPVHTGVEFLVNPGQAAILDSHRGSSSIQLLEADGAFSTVELNEQFDHMIADASRTSLLLSQDALRRTDSPIVVVDCATGTTRVLPVRGAAAAWGEGEEVYYTTTRGELRRIQLGGTDAEIVLPPPTWRTQDSFALPPVIDSVSRACALRWHRVSGGTSHIVVHALDLGTTLELPLHAQAVAFIAGSDRETSPAA